MRTDFPPNDAAADAAFLMLDTRAIDSIMTTDSAIDCAARALRKTSNGIARQDVRRTLMLPGAAGSCLSMMYADIDDADLFGAKVLSVFPDNFRHGFGSHRGIVMLFEKRHGRPVALLDGGALTGWRTAAASAVATRALSRPDSRVLGLIGYGEQAHRHVETLSRVRPFDTLVVTGRDPSKAAAFAAHWSGRGLHARALPDARAVAAMADVICTVTSAQTPVLFADWLRPGTHVNAVGASVLSCRELDQACVARAGVWVDYMPMALSAAAELVDAIDSGLIARDDLRGEIGATLEGQRPGRRSADEITLYRSLGVPAQDIELANHLVAAARAGGLGQTLEFGL